MRIENGLPFESCQSCKLCILDVDDKLSVCKSLDAENTYIHEKVVHVGCRNERKCRSRRVKEGLKNAKYRCD